MMRFLLLFLLLPTYGMSQIWSFEEAIFKSQKDIFKAKKIKQIKISGTNILTKFITLNENGILSELNVLCYDSTNLDTKAKFDNNGNEIYSASFDYECKGQLEDEWFFIYDDTLIVEVSSQIRNGFCHVRSKTFYDSIRRKIKYLSYSSLHDVLGYWEEYSYPNDSTRIKLRINDDSTLINKEISTLNENGQVLKSFYFSKEGKTSWYEYSYNKYFQLTRKAGYFYPSKELITEKRITFDEFGKIIREDYEYSNGKSYEIYIYNNEGLLIESVYDYDYGHGDGERSKKYEYFN